MFANNSLVWLPAIAAAAITLLHIAHGIHRDGTLARIWAGRRGGIPEYGDVHSATLGYYYYSPTAGPDTVSQDEELQLASPWKAPNWSDRSSRIPPDAEHPTAVARDGLRSHARWLDTGDRRFVNRLAASADWLVERQGPQGDYRYTFPWHELPAGWVSGLGQGAAISALARAYQETGDERYLDTARRAYEFMLTPVESGGCLGRYSDVNQVVEEYPGIPERHPQVLNGAISAYFGVHDLMRITRDEQVAAQFDILIASLKANLYRYQAEPLSRYNTLESSRASLMYHRMHIRQLGALAAITGDEYFTQVATAFRQQVQSTPGMIRVAAAAVPSRLDRPFKALVAAGSIAAVAWFIWGLLASTTGLLDSALGPIYFVAGSLASLTGLLLMLVRINILKRLDNAWMRPKHVFKLGAVIATVGMLIPGLAAL